MAITGNSSYIPTINEFLAHWAQANAAMAPSILTVRLPDNTICIRDQFIGMRQTLQDRQGDVQDALIAQLLARSVILEKKTALLESFNLFVAFLDAYYQANTFYAARPYAPTMSAGQEVFSAPMVDMVKLWARMNVGLAPAGVTLPLVLDNGIGETDFADAVAALQTAYENERDEAQGVVLARANRGEAQEDAYAVMKSYREAVPARLSAFPAIVETLPRLTPLPGHTPEAVNASAIFQEPNATKVVYDASTDVMLDRYELRGTVGDHYDDEDAVVIDTHLPNETREFVTTFGLNQPGAEIALKVFVVLTTGNEAGSATMLVERPANVQLLAA